MFLKKPGPGGSISVMSVSEQSQSFTNSSSRAGWYGPNEHWAQNGIRTKRVSIEYWAVLILQYHYLTAWEYNTNTDIQDGAARVVTYCSSSMHSSTSSWVMKPLRLVFLFLLLFTVLFSMVSFPWLNILASFRPFCNLLILYCAAVASAPCIISQVWDQ